MPKSIDSQSYYTATANRVLSYPSLKGSIKADVCIIGTGYTGLSAALELAEAGYKVVVLEARTSGYGGSGRNGGQICTGFSPGQHKLETQLGKSDAVKCFQIAEEAKGLIVDRIARHRIDCDLKWGYLHVIPKPTQFDHLKQWKAEWDALGYTDTQILTKQDLEARLGTAVYHG